MPLSEHQLIALPHNLFFTHFVYFSNVYRVKDYSVPPVLVTFVEMGHVSMELAVMEAIFDFERSWEVKGQT